MELDMTFNQILIVALAVLAGSIAMVAMGQAAAIAALAPLVVLVVQQIPRGSGRTSRGAADGCGDDTSGEEGSAL
ncbi:hypothetical protein [Streptomyces zhihengii]|uniref:DUF2933 domain-containing protein n=1 Tax=Streptomyces zhihengii TaxID=1818004 RepID=A0ABS2V4Q1_9ACTN|nr:hypothetical protein [Streptomyces zhihengii]MBM9624745.1 hypothetical protein [Streptomyces zhihengii]